MVGMFIAFPAAQAGVEVRVASNPRPDRVSGGDVLIQVDLPAGVTAGDVRVTLNGRDVTSNFHTETGALTLTGLLTGLTMGTNTVDATVRSDAESRLTVVNHPNAGPVFAGPHEQPFVCETRNFKLQSGGTLGPALDENCSIVTRVDYLYRSAAGGELKALANGAGLPADVVMVTTLTGQRVPYVVRIETGTINRAIYQIAMLHSPSEPAPDVFTRSAGWNGRLIYTFGGGCTGGWYRQGTSTGGVLDDVMLQRGYAVASATLNTFGNN
jgi:hypothetical protein